MAQNDAEEEANYHRLASLVVDVGSEALRDVMLTLIIPETPENFIQKNNQILNQLLQQRVLHQDQYDLLIKPVPDPNEFDISLLFVIIRNVCPNVIPPLRGWKVRNPDVNDYSLGAELLRLTCTRNKIAHIPSTKIATQEFEDLWNELKRIICRISRHGSPNKAQYIDTKIDELKMRPLEPIRKSRLETFLIWLNQGHDMHAAVLQQMEGHLTCIKTQNDSILDKEEEIKTNAEETKIELTELNKSVDEIKGIVKTLSKQNSVPNAVSERLEETSKEQSPCQENTEEETDEIQGNREVDQGAGQTALGDSVSVLSRSQWGGQPAKRFEFMATPVSVVFIHHTGRVECFFLKDCCEEMRNIQNLHMLHNGWDDIGYNFVIGGDGRVYEGRGWDRVGAHTLGWNSVSVSFAVMGDFHDHLPTQNAMNAICNLMDHGVKYGKLTPDFKLYGHRDARPTPSPGEKLYRRIREWPQYDPEPPLKISSI